MKPLGTADVTLARPPASDPGFRLRPDEVDVWRVGLDDQPGEAVRFMQTLISTDEAQRARGFYFERDRIRYLMGRGTLRMLLGRYLGRAPRDVVFQYGSNGKPALKATPGEPALHFNVAHSEGVALFALTRGGEVGIDVERIRDLPDWEQVAEAAFSSRELAQLRACPPEQRRDEFFRAWTRQEAVLKALGTGLAGFRTADTETAFNVHPLDAGPGYAAALAAAPSARCPAQLWEWRSEAKSGVATSEARASSASLLTPLDANFL